eukprot:TRINITY_DN810_c0_g2_i6.p1 TRINITY_DN810_c0_g2~~TRINITY_DN810_c0_g2_i6.p1  ORF type:complete len:126 (+),score=1.64 TRINITY_DN810_c0_g2_i6:536-913(+)
MYHWYDDRENSDFYEVVFSIDPQQLKMITDSKSVGVSILLQSQADIVIVCKKPCRKVRKNPQNLFNDYRRSRSNTLTFWPNQYICLRPMYLYFPGYSDSHINRSYCFKWIQKHLCLWYLRWKLAF